MLYLIGTDIHDVNYDSTNSDFTANQTFTTNYVDMSEIVNLINNNLNEFNAHNQTWDIWGSLRDGMIFINNNGNLESFVKDAGTVIPPYKLGYLGVPIMVIPGSAFSSALKITLNLSNNYVNCDFYLLDTDTTNLKNYSYWGQYFNYNYFNKDIFTVCYNNYSNTYAAYPIITTLIGNNVDDAATISDKFTHLYNLYNMWNYAPTQFAISNSESIYKGTFYGKNGDVVGTLSQNTGLTSGDELRTRAKIYDSFSYLTSDPNVGINLAWTFSNLNSIPVCNIQNIINCEHAFSQYKGDTIDVSQFDISNTTDCYYMFGDSCNLTEIKGIENFDTSNVYYFGAMFYRCANLTNVNFLTNWNFSNASTTGYMFYQCNNLTEISVDLSNHINIVELCDMFESCTNLITVNFNVANLTNVSNMDRMFYGCENLQNLNNLEYIDCLNITHLTWVFYSCYNLVNIPNLVNTSNVTNLEGIFASCTNLAEVANFDTTKINGANCMFEYCTNIVNIPNYNFSNLRYAQGMFLGCTNLVNVPVLNLINLQMAYNMFSNCNNLSDASYANIINSLPDASQMYNKFVSNIGLDINRFTTAQKTILKNKGYVDMGENQYTITYS